METNTVQKPPAQNQEAPKQNALKHAFAVAKKLEPKLMKVGLTTEDLWDYLKNAYGVQSRADLTEKQRVVIAARLDAAQRDTPLFRALTQEIRKYKLTTVDAICDVIQRENKALVDVTLYHSHVLFSTCVVNIENMTVRGRQVDLSRIVAHINPKDVNHMTQDMLKNAILDYVVNTTQVDLQTEPTLKAISEILKQHNSWMHLNDMLQALKTDKQEFVLEILRSCYRQQLIEHNPYGTGLWFRWKQQP